jgi:hypothetical protein
MDLQKRDGWDMALKRQIMYRVCWMGGRMNWLNLSLSGYALSHYNSICVYIHISSYFELVPKLLPRVCQICEAYELGGRIDG